MCAPHVVSFRSVVALGDVKTDVTSEGLSAVTVAIGEVREDGELADGGGRSLDPQQVLDIEDALAGNESAVVALDDGGSARSAVAALGDVVLSSAGTLLQSLESRC